MQWSEILLSLQFANGQNVKQALCMGTAYGNACYLGYMSSDNHVFPSAFKENVDQLFKPI